MHYALIMAGGSGTRLWPMSRADEPKQLIPFIRGKSLLHVAADRLDGLVPAAHQFICTGEKFRAAIHAAIPRFTDEQILGEPQGRDTLAAVGFPAAVLAQRDPQALIAVFTADHLIEPIDVFQQRVRTGLTLAQEHPNTLVTFGIEPTFPATQYGYVRLGPPLPDAPGAHRVESFKEKPDAPTAKQYLDSGEYLWNSGMFVWRAATLMEVIRRRQPQVHAGLTRIAQAWDTPRRQAVLDEVYPTLKKISVDYAVMEPAAADPDFAVACVRMPVRWLDVGGWPAFAQTLPADTAGNRHSAAAALLDASDNLVASSDEKHLVALLGVRDLVVVHTPHATLVAHRDEIDKLKQLHQLIAQQFGPGYL